MQLLAQVRRYDLPRARAPSAWSPAANPSSSTVRPMRSGRAWPRSASCQPTGRVLYAGDLTAGCSYERSVAGGGDVVISDSNRRQAFVPGSLEQNVGPVLAPLAGRQRRRDDP